MNTPIISSLFRRFIFGMRSIIARRKLASVGDQFSCGASVAIHGGENIHVGNRVAFSTGLRISAWPNYKSQIFRPKLVIGDGCLLNEWCHITCTNSISIGNGVLLGKFVTITDNSHGSSDHASLLCAPLDRAIVSKGPVVIGDNVWIGDKATILPAVTIGSNSIIGANSVVTTNIPAFSIAAGNPARVIRTVSL